MMLFSRNNVVRSTASAIGNRKMSNFFVVNNKSVLEGLRSAPGKKVLYFNNNWHVMCREVAPVFQKMSEQYPSITFVTINLEVFTEAATELQVNMVPTLVFTSGKIVLSKLIGSNEMRITKTVKKLSEHQGFTPFEPEPYH